jgi:hypothetical protein
VPRVTTTLSPRDLLGTIGARTGFIRNDYKITPGLYATGTPTESSPVLVTANYKLSFDALRKELSHTDAWILVIDTRGINVWCAAGKGTFSAEEVSYQVQNAQLEKVVSHRELILPQLSANGVAARNIKNLCGFKGRFGPILSSMLPEFLESGKADEKMRSVTFTIKERAVLIPLEICLLWKHLLVACMRFFVLSGISPEIFSLQTALPRSATLLAATFGAMLSGAVITPLLLPWIPFRQFWLKGAVLGALAATFFLFQVPPDTGMQEKASLFLWITGCASYLAMNFTGSTPFTSLSGVSKEMRRGLPFQIASTVLAVIFWVTSPFF